MADGALGTHLQKLESLQYITCQKQFVGRRPKSSYQITDFRYPADAGRPDHCKTRLVFLRWVSRIQGIIRRGCSKRRYTVAAIRGYRTGFIERSGNSRCTLRRSMLKPAKKSVTARIDEVPVAVRASLVGAPASGRSAASPLKARARATRWRRERRSRPRRSIYIEGTPRSQLSF